MAFKQAEPLTAPPPMPFNPGGQERLKKMFESHHEYIWRLMCRRGCDDELAADVTQQAFLIAAQRVDDIRPGCERAFLAETGIRLARATHRSLNRMELEEDMDVHEAPPMSADEVLDQGRALKVLDRILGKLSPDLLEVFLLFEMEHISMREIAGMLAIPSGTVASRLRRAREAFRAEAARIERAMLRRRQV